MGRHDDAGHVLQCVAEHQLFMKMTLSCMRVSLSAASLGGQMQQLYSWGKLKTNGDGLMYPVADQNLSGEALMMHPGDWSL
jgi:hypothetical protein